MAYSAPDDNGISIRMKNVNAVTTYNFTVWCQAYQGDANDVQGLTTSNALVDSLQN